MKTLLSVLVIGLLAYGKPVLAASQSECAIWLCLPGGFPSGCGSAHSAMLKRIRDFKPPLPSFSSCAISGGSVNLPSRDSSSMSFDSDYAAYIPGKKVCTGGGRYGGPKQCTEKGAQYIKGTKCRTTGRFRIPFGCTDTVVYVDIFSDGQPLRDTLYVPF